MLMTDLICGMTLLLDNVLLYLESLRVPSSCFVSLLYVCAAIIVRSVDCLSEFRQYSYMVAAVIAR